ncbi:hypothetical protein DUD99_16115 [Salmonella enterica subsp. enterica]|nr:hypothetical protein [Salmonella enterica]EAC2143747.1 hypothetical protein [Salmonella enterica subsp. enterica]EDW0652913.1 formylglycine-generating enzyme family protein [Salmonella enterica subsp. enterica serovar Weslaco]EAW1858144.1 hypothetical protein [Salmonella enterica subsp. enterica]EAW1861749.1 hypothetical protein [Salmonella enterica subsp. enterica]
MTGLLADTHKFLLSGMVVLLLLSGCDNKQKEIKLADEQLADMVFVEGGSFMMGDFGPTMGEHLPFSDEQDDKPLHKVTLDSFSMSKYRVTWQQFNRYLDIQGKPKTKAYKRLKSLSEKDSFSKFAGDTYPATVLWQEAKDYCLWVGKVSGRNVDLPTEAQWEYAARSRGQPFIMANKDNVWHKDEEGENKSFANLEPVGSYPPNPLGLYDMMGNGFDWVNDWYNPDYYQSSPERNPTGPEKGDKKVLRGSGGASYWVNLTILRWSDNINGDKGEANIGYGFRCAINEVNPL